MWDVHKGTLLHTLTGHTEEIEVSHLMVTLQNLIADLATDIHIAMAMISFTNYITEKTSSNPVPSIGRSENRTVTCVAIRIFTF